MIVLASSSPARARLLGMLGLRFRVEPPPPVEDGEPFLPATLDRAVETAVGRALAKARSVTRGKGEVVLAADTLVFTGEYILGKARDECDARRMLGMLRGRWHLVITGYAVLGRGST